MFLNMYLTSEWSQSKSDFVVAVLHRGHWSSTSCYDSLGSSWKVWNILWLKFLSGRVKQHLFTLLCSQRLILGHVPLNANELIFLILIIFLPWKSKGDFQIIIKKYKVSDLLVLQVQLDHEQWVLIYPWILTF